MTLMFFICPAKLIIGRTLEIWQLDVLVMKIIYIKKLWAQTRFTPILKLLYSAFALSAKSEKSHQGKRQ